MWTSGSRGFISATPSLPQAALVRHLSVLQQSKSQLVERAQADLNKDLNLGASSRAALARRLNGPSIPVPRSGDILQIPSRLRGKAKAFHRKTPPAQATQRLSNERPRTGLITPASTTTTTSTISSVSTAQTSTSVQHKSKQKKPLKQWVAAKPQKKRTVKVTPPTKHRGGRASKVPVSSGKEDRSRKCSPVISSEMATKLAPLTIDQTAAVSPEQGSASSVTSVRDLEPADIDEVTKESPPHFEASEDTDTKTPMERIAQGSISARDVQITGVHPMHDPRTGVWNFEEEALHAIPQPIQFAFDRVPSYVSPSGDKELSDLAEEHNCRFTGSTSTLTKALSQVYFALSGGRGVDLKTLSQAFSYEKTDFTAGASLPASIIMGKKENGQYFVDSDKQWDVENVLSDFGVVLEKMLTTEKDDFSRFLNSNPLDEKTVEERTRREAYRYQKSGTILMRSQLDCYDPRLPGTGVFDIKTRACLPIRFDRANYIANSLYDISKERGFTQSYEKEYYDLIRAGMLKFSFQVRIGAMDGIFVAYHNTARIYGFQYLPLTELDERLFGSSEMAEQAFKLCVSLLEVLLAEVVKAFPDQEIEVTIKRIGSVKLCQVGAFVQPRHWDEAEGPRPIQLISLLLESFLDGERIAGPIAFSPNEQTRRTQTWSVDYSLSKTRMDASSQAAASGRLQAARKMLGSMMYIALPEGKTMEQMKGDERQSIRNPIDKDFKGVKWKEADRRLLALRQEAKESGEAYALRRSAWKKDQKSWLPA